MLLSQGNARAGPGAARFIVRTDPPRSDAACRRPASALLALLAFISQSVAWGSTWCVSPCWPSLPVCCCRPGWSDPPARLESPRHWSRCWWGHPRSAPRPCTAAPAGRGFEALTPPGRYGVGHPVPLRGGGALPPERRVSPVRATLVALGLVPTRGGRRGRGSAWRRPLSCPDRGIPAGVRSSPAETILGTALRGAIGAVLSPFAAAPVVEGAARLRAPGQ